MHDNNCSIQVDNSVQHKKSVSPSIQNFDSQPDLIKSCKGEFIRRNDLEIARTLISNRIDTFLLVAIEEIFAAQEWKKLPNFWVIWSVCRLDEAGYLELVYALLSLEIKKGGTA